jgi:putative ABC transport system permease protein
LASVKISGIALGSAVFLLTSLFTLHELDYDKQHASYNRIFRYVHVVNSPDGIDQYAFTSATTAPALVERYPFINAYCRLIFPAVSVRNAKSVESFNEVKFGFADRNFFTFFNFPLAGETDLKTILDDPMEVVLTPAASKKYFQDEDPVGKTLVINGELLFTVTGILKEAPSKSHLNFDFIASFASLDVIKNHPLISQQIPASLNLETKGFAAFYTYLQLSSASAEEKLIQLLPSFIEDFRGQGRSARLKPTLQELQPIHLESDLLYEIAPNGSLRLVQVFFSVGLLILIISCINYVNISTAEYINRSPGIGLKKILGINRSSLVLTHLVETSLFCAISLLTGMFLAFLAMPWFNTLVNRDIVFFRIETAIVISFTFLLTVIISGIYPALHITKARAIETFRGTSLITPGSFGLRNSLVFVQLVSSFCLLIFSILIYQQVDYILHKDLGFDAPQVLAVNATTTPPEKRVTFKSRLIGNKNILAVGMCSTPPGESFFSYGINYPENTADEERRIAAYQSYVDTDYLTALGVDLLHGRFYGNQDVDSGNYIIINSAAAAALGESPLNRDVEIPGVFIVGKIRKNIIGIIQDFNFASLHESIEPLALEYSPDKCRYLLVRIEPNSAASSIRTIENIWKETMPGEPFDYTFLDQRFENFYHDEQHQKLIFSFVAVVAIVLACMGIFGTTLFLAQRKTKEVSIRKILGSGSVGIMLMLFKPSFLILLLSCLAGTPVAIFLGNHWLSQYPYHIDVLLWWFPATFLVMLVIVSLTVLYHFLGITKINPVEVLRKTS